MRLSYDRALYAETRQANNLDWSGITAEIDTSGLTSHSFNIRGARLSGRLRHSAFVGGAIENTSLVNLSVEQTSFDSLLVNAVDFSEAFFYRSWMTEWHIDRSKFKRARLRHTRIDAEIIRTSFAEAQLEDVDFRNSQLTDVDFTGASLDEVRFDFTRLFGVDLSSTKTLSQTSWKGAIYDCRTRLPTTLNPIAAGMIASEGTCYGRANNRDFTSAAYADIRDWTKLDLAGARFAGSRVSGNFELSTLNGADLSDTNVQDAYFQNTNLRDARFNRAVIEGTHFYEADLRGADFSDVKLKLIPSLPLFNKCKYDARTKWPATVSDDSGRTHSFIPAAHGAILVKD
jgi:uncharacterized protein YjbI with pentapeptide repeats